MHSQLHSNIIYVHLFLSRYSILKLGADQYRILDGLTDGSVLIPWGFLCLEDKKKNFGGIVIIIF